MTNICKSEEVKTLAGKESGVRLFLTYTWAILFIAEEKYWHPAFLCCFFFH